MTEGEGTYVDHEGVERCTLHDMVAAWCVDCMEQGVKSSCGVLPGVAARL